MGWMSRGVKEINIRFEKANADMQDQIRKYEERWTRCSQIFSKNASPSCETPCAIKDASTTEKEII
jgi:rRNA maturation endonuclease Nob1